ncbi:hypothetical protein LEN26_011593 [Aphanomyces euteiches]|nr:hypothetical protein AeMF1_015760 [Aphanomyces euteiches]KAH9119510.1 hypothetical protein LEN26_011593 [Aphanomyces euteiches]KAH9194951.1 hypothetical protein AeNC1_003059 [Aphanomyces euteiches]
MTVEDEVTSAKALVNQLLRSGIEQSRFCTSELEDATFRGLTTRTSLDAIKNLIEVATPATTVKFTLHLEDGSCVIVVVGVSATYSTLLKEIQCALKSTVKRSISWKYMWRHYGLECNGVLLEIPRHAKSPVLDFITEKHNVTDFHLRFVRRRSSKS